MRRLCWSLALLGALGAPLGAQAPEADPPVRLTVRPAAAPSPALRYHLLPEVGDQTPGNAVQLYYRAFSPEWMNWVYRDQAGEKLAEWLETTGAEPPPKEFAGLRGSNQLKELDRAARRANCDWELLERARQEGIGLLLPDIHSFRTFAQMLAGRARLEIAAGDFDQAAYTLQTGFAMARHTAQAPLLINALVGFAAAGQMTRQVERFIQQPGSPNLYWALTYLPQPFIPLRGPMEGERLLVDATFPEVADLQKRVYTAAEMDAVLDRVADHLRPLTAGPGGADSRLAVRLFLTGVVLKHYPRAKQYLLAEGRTPEQVAAVPAAQAVLLLARHEYMTLFDEHVKWDAFPYPVAQAGRNAAERHLKGLIGSGEILPLARLLLPAVLKIYQAQVRLDRRIAALRVIEALRLHAAAHDGRWPARLEDVTAVPVPPDPFTGMPFVYRAEGDRAFLRGQDARPGARGDYVINYELVLQK